jgi:hypothetical protein
MILYLTEEHREKYREAQKYNGTWGLVTQTCTVYQALHERLPDSNIIVENDCIIIDDNVFDISKKLQLFIDAEDNHVQMHMSPPTLGKFRVRVK